MRTSLLALTVLVISTSQVFASPIPSSGSLDSITARDILEQRATRNGSGSAHSGNSGNVGGGTVTNSGSPAGTVTNEDGSSLGGNGGTTSTGNTSGRPGRPGSPGTASAGTVSNSGGTINNDCDSSLDGSAGTSHRGSNMHGRRC